MGLSGVRLIGRCYLQCCLSVEVGWLPHWTSMSQWLSFVWRCFFAMVNDRVRKCVFGVHGSVGV